MIDDLFEALVDGVARGRGVEPAQVRRWIDEGPYLAEEAREAGFVDDVIYADEVPARLAALAPGKGGGGLEPEQARPIPLSAYLRLSRVRFRWRPVVRGAPEIAVVPVVGMIRRGPATRAVVATLQQLEKLDSVKGVVLRVDSPGGDPLASEQIWRAVRKLREAKPVVASLADRAASGGYYLAMASDEVVAEPTTLTGSIGVVLASVDLSALLERLGVGIDGVERGRHSGIFDPTRPRSDEERALLRRHVHRLYEDFVRKAAEGRGLSIEEVELAAQGRVWSGRRAREQRLVDHVGGADVALGRIRALCGLGESEGEVIRVSPLISPLARLVRPDPIQVMDGAPRGAWLWCPIHIPLR